MRQRFTKMQGAGNDFVVIDATRAPFALDAAQIRRLGDRRFGVGCDQLLVVEPADGADHDFRYRIFNGGDGSEVQQCGNGARCFVRFCVDHGLTAADTIRVRTVNAVLTLRLMPDGRVRVDMGAPRFAPADAALRSPRAPGPLHCRRNSARRLAWCRWATRMQSGRWRTWTLRRSRLLRAAGAMGGGLPAGRQHRFPAGAGARPGAPARL
jgi:diaminopimelate epimerase